MRHLTLLPFVALLAACHGQVEDTGDTGPAIQVVDVSTGDVDECETLTEDAVVLLELDERPVGASVLCCVVAPNGAEDTESCYPYGDWVMVTYDAGTSWTIAAVGTIDGICREDLHYLVSYW